MEPRSLKIQDKCSSTELHPRHPLSLFLHWGHTHGFISCCQWVLLLPLFVEDPQPPRVSCLRAVAVSCVLCGWPQAGIQARSSRGRRDGFGPCGRDGAFTSSSVWWKHQISNSHHTGGKKGEFQFPSVGNYTTINKSSWLETSLMRNQ